MEIWILECWKETSFMIKEKDVSERGDKSCYTTDLDGDKQSAEI